MNEAGQDMSGVRSALSDLEERVGPHVERVRDRLSTFNARALQLMRTYPGTCLVCAVGVGFLLGRIASRR